MKDGPKLSHMFFADDLVLIVEASMAQIDVLISCLDRFCASSGQKVGNSKSRIFRSKNVSHGLSKALSRKFGCSLTNNLGRYLGVPLLHGRITKDT